MSVSSRTRRRSLCILATATLFTLVGTTAASAAPGVGAPGIGDPYYPDYGNGGYDVGHYSIDVGYTPATGELTGRTTVRATAKQSLRRFNLDLLLPASSVVVNGRAAEFGRSADGHELIVRPLMRIRAGESMVVEVEYAGRPAEISDNGLKPWIATADGAIAVGQPEIAAWWFPSNDHPRDKATFDIAITVPRGVEAISNGRLASVTQVGELDRWSWSSALPMATYLAYFVIGQLDVTSGTTASGVPWLNAIGVGSGVPGAAAAADLARTAEVVDWLADQWGPYPFEALGGVMPNGPLLFALETQTRPA
jgi:aminopeptidase N